VTNDTIPRHAIKLSEKPGSEVLISEAEAQAIADWLDRKERFPSDTIKRTVHQRIVQAMRAVSHVAKDGYNTHFKYPFRGIDGVTNALGPALREAGVFPTEEILEIAYRDGRNAKDDPTREVTVRIKITFWGEDGDHLVTEGVGESIDQSDKGTAKAVSVARRVAYLGVFLLPTQEPTTDHDGHYHQRGGQPQMSRFERDTGRNMLAIPTPEVRAAIGSEMIDAAFRQALAFRICIEEHSAWEQPSNGDESPTWEELFTARVAAEIAAVATPEAGRALYGLLKAEGLDMAYNGVKFSQLLKERAAEMQAAQAQLVNELTEGILGASLETLQDAWAAAYDARGAGRITEDQLTELHKLTNDRQAKLEREQNQTAAEAEVKSWDTAATS
jgi:hypothetical protein